MIQNKSQMTAEEMSEILNISKRAVEKHLSKMKKDNIIERIGPTKSGYWEVIKK
jgi:ATP-dependent DNA helicase RecG